MGQVKSANKGFSLIELMISMAVSLLIIASLFYSLIGDMKSYESIRSTQGLVSKSRMAVQTIKLYISQAGFRQFTDVEYSKAFESTTSTAGWVWSSGQILQGTVSSSTVDDEKTDSDIIVLRFSGAEEIGMVSCDGTNLTSTDINEITLYVNVNDQLMCRNNNDTAILIDENIEFLELLYGTDETPNRYFLASEIDDWASVNRIKIGMLLSQVVTASSFTNSNNYTIFNQTISAQNDSSLRAVVMETVAINNQQND